MTDVIRVALPAREVYRLLTEYFDMQRDMKMESCFEPSDIKVKVGGWTDRYPPGVMNVQIVSKDEESEVKLNCDFKRTYGVTAVIGGLIELFLISTFLLVTNFGTRLVAEVAGGIGTATMLNILFMGITVRRSEILRNHVREFLEGVQHKQGSRSR